MSNLVQQLGSRYMRDWFQNAYFRIGDKVHKLRSVSDSEQLINTNSLDLKTGVPKWEPDSVNADAINSMTAFQFPKLGYRQFHQGKMGIIVVQISSMRTATRGLKDEILKYDVLLPWLALHNHPDSFDAVSSPRRIQEIFNPKFTSFSAGISEMLNGKSLGFVVNEDLCCVMSVGSNMDRFIDVMFRGRIVGHVDERGQLTLTNKILQRDHIKRKLFK